MPKERFHRSFARANSRVKRNDSSSTGGSDADNPRAFFQHRAQLEEKPVKCEDVDLKCPRQMFVRKIHRRSMNTTSRAMNEDVHLICFRFNFGENIFESLWMREITTNCF